MKKFDFEIMFGFLLILVLLGIAIWQISSIIDADIPLWLKLKLLFG